MCYNSLTLPISGTDRDWGQAKAGPYEPSRLACEMRIVSIALFVFFLEHTESPAFGHHSLFCQYTKLSIVEYLLTRSCLLYH